MRPLILTRPLVLALGSFVLVSAGTSGAEPAARPSNRLARESSPYLLQHAHNPVDWYPWGPEAFARAKKENKLIFLSIGYSSCHWCHVMERESFENAAVAKLLNDSFVCIKVDREERPDVDQIYMTALQSMGQNGGWPMSMFLTADGKPFFGGTYWPADDRDVRGETVRGFKSVLAIVARLHREKPKELERDAERFAAHVAEVLSRSDKEVMELKRDVVTAALTGLREEFDPTYGGFGSRGREFRGPKFPMASNLAFLLGQAKRQAAGEPGEMVRQTLDRMAQGGVYDQLGGGFHRYTVERTWTVPHFEKMLYDNAQLVEAYSRAFQQQPNPLYRRVVEETLDFVGRELTAPEGGFYSSLDADSEGHEGQYYVWSAKEIDAILTEPGEAAVFKKVFGVEGKPNFEDDRYVLTRIKPLAEAAGELKLTEDQAAERLRVARAKVLAARLKRVRPGLDTKVLTAWNGQMIAAYAVAGDVFREPRHLAAAAKAADFVLRALRASDGRLLRAYGSAPGEAGQGRLNGYLDDYAFLVHGLLALHDATAEPRWLDEARTLTDRMVAGYGDADRGGFFFTSSDHEKLFARAKEASDGAQPSGNGVAALDLVRLAQKTGEAKYRELAERTMRAFGTALQERPETLPTMVTALDLLLVAQTDSAKPQPAQAGGGPKKSDSVVKVNATAEKPGAGGRQVVTVTLKVDPGWHVYANPIGNETQESSQTVVAITSDGKPRDAQIDYPKGKRIKDPLVGDYSVYDGEVTIKATVVRAAGDTGPLEVKVKFQSCSDKTCLVPATVKLTVP
jgi:uncharacterized protein YyaL (SSP411 family)